MDTKKPTAPHKILARAIQTILHKHRDTPIVMTQEECQQIADFLAQHLLKFGVIAPAPRRTT